MRIGNLCCFLLLVPCLAAGQGVSSQESDALMDLCVATNGPTWFNNANWETSAPSAAGLV